MMLFKIFLIIVEVITSVLLIVVILLQRSKGEGLGLAFGAQMGESLFGARASNVLVKITIWLGIIFLVTTALLARMYAQGYRGSLMERQAPVESGSMPIQPIKPAPGGFPASQPAMPDAQPVIPQSQPTLPEAPPAPASAPAPEPAAEPQPGE